MIATEQRALNANSNAKVLPLATQLQQLAQLFNQGYFAEAKTQAQTLSRQFPKQGSVWKILGVILQQEGLQAEAGVALQKAATLLPKDAEAHYNLANWYYDAQQLQEAKNSYQKAVKLAPKFVQAHYNLASVLKDLKQLSLAEASYKNALKLSPQDATLQFGYGLLLHAQKRYQEAIKQYQKAMVSAPDDASIYLNLGAVQRELGELTQAEQSYRQALALNPQHAGAYNNLGIVLKERGQAVAAEAAYLEAIALDGAYIAAYKNLGLLYKDIGNNQASEACYLKALSIAPPTAETLNNMAVVMINQGRYAEAETLCRQALEMDAKLGDIWNNLGLVLQAKLAHDEAEAAFEKALALQPDDVQTLNNYSVTLKSQGKLELAESSLKKALQTNPNFADAYLNLGNVYLDQGLIGEAIVAFQRVLEIVPQHIGAHDNLLFAMTYSNQYGFETQSSIAKKYGSLVADKAQPYTSWNLESPPEVLRVGVVSGDLRQHPVGYFLKNVVQHISPQKIQLFAYSTDGREDAATAELKPYFTQWKSLAGHNDAAAAAIIYQDNLHMLLDLSGHTGGNKLPLFAWKPAPVQASWLGYWATTGIAEMDYVLVDEVSVPAQQQAQFTEQVHYLPHTRMCFSAPDTAQEVTPLPALSNGFITFGCFQNLTKVNEEVMQLWGKVMQAIPNATLRWQCKNFSDAQNIAKVMARLARHGITAERVQLLGKVSREAYLAAYSNVDIMLDSFPFTGGTTTCEALWMGVPTITLAGNSLIAKQGAALMTAAGLADWVVSSKNDYIKTAVDRAKNIAQLAKLRAGLRAQVNDSALFDGQLFAQHFEQALLRMWQEKQPDLKLKSEKSQLNAHGRAMLNNAQAVIEIISATRMTEQEFWQQSALGRSLQQHMQQSTNIRANVAFNNTCGLSTIFNNAIAQASDDAVLVFVHDDVWLDETDLANVVIAGLEKYSVIGVAGTRRRVANQPAWAFIDTNFTWDQKQNLSGRVGHGQNAFGEVSEYGDVPAQCELLDGVFLAAKKSILVQHQVHFDTQFDFHFYDLDFCRTATKAGLTLGTWPVKLTHQSAGAFGSEAWQKQYANYLNKWEITEAQVADKISTQQIQAAEVKVFDLTTVDAVVKQFKATNLLPAMTYESPVVATFGEACPNAMVQQTCQITHPPVWMAAVDNLQVIGSVAFPIIQNKSVLHQYFSTDIWETSEQGLNYCRIRQDQGLIAYTDLAGEEKHTAKVINLIGNGSSNYAHWITEFLPQIVLLQQAGVDISQYQILVDAYSYPSMLEALYQLGVKEQQLIKIKQLSLHQFPHALWVSPVANVVFQRPGALQGVGKDMLSEPTHAIFHPQALKMLRDTFTSKVSAEIRAAQPEKIMIKRTPGRKTNLHQLVNEQEIETLLVANGFVSIDPSQLNFAQQVTLFSNARYIVSASGAALVNMLWAPAGAQVIVLMNDTRYANYWYFANIAACAGHHLSYVLGKALPSKYCPDLHHADFKIDEQALISAFEYAGLADLQNPKQALGEALQEVLNLATQSQQAGEFAAAEQLYQEILKINPQHAQANHQLGVLEAQRSQFESALLRLELAVQEQPESEQFWVSYLDALMLAGDPAQALTALELGVQFGLTTATAEVLRAEFEQAVQLKQSKEISLIAEEKAQIQPESSQQSGLICTLIPGYKTAYLEELLLSLSTQTYRQFKVIISDDSPNNEVTNLVKQLHLKGQLKGMAVEVVEGPKKGGFANIYHLVRNFAQQAEFFHILMDDDLIYPTFYETHIREHSRKHANVSISARWNANESGQPCAMTMDEATSSSFVEHFDAASIAKALIPGCNNKLGEFSHAVFRREAAPLLLNPTIAGISYFGLDDIGAFINAAEEFPAIWIPAPLGIFRTNPHQNTGKLTNATIKCAHYGWISLALIAEEKGWISSDEAWASVTFITNTIRVRYQNDNLGKSMLEVLDRYKQLDAAFKQAFLAVWNAYLDEIQVKKVLAGDLSVKLL